MIRAALLALCLCSCVATTGDLERIHARVNESEARILGVVEDVRAGIASQEDVLCAVQAEVAETERTTARVASESRQRGIGLAEAGLYLAAQLLTGYSAYRVTMSKRDHARILRAEPVAVPKASRKTKGLA